MASSKSKTPLRIGVVQFDPKIGEVQNNIARVRQLCSKVQPNTLDLLCLPEMCFSGYVFQSPEEISPFLESANNGQTSLFCKEEAIRLHCCVVAGYPESLEASSPNVHGRVGYNSAIMYSPTGELIGNYRKTHLYDTDLSWAVPGDGFATLHPPAPLPNPITLAICMDLNSQVDLWTAESGPYEVAEHAVRTKSKLVILLNNWLDSGHEVDDSEDWSTVQYWSTRLRPLYCTPDGKGKYRYVPPTTPPRDEDVDDETIVVVCNRCGIENGITFAGSSSIFSLSRTIGKPRLLDMMGRKEEGVRIWNILI